MLFWQRWILKSPLRGIFKDRYGYMARVNGLDIWYDHFGDKNNPALLLLMGAGCQGVLWTQAFCYALASKGFFVIRFDYRDTGFSSYCNYEKTPYTLKDMALDALGILDHLGIDKAHFMGISMGGAIAQILGANYANRVKTLTLIATTNDFAPLVSLMEAVPLQEPSLSFPSKAWFTWMDELKKIPYFAFRKKVQKHLEGWKILNGPDVPFEKEYYHELMKESIKRQRSSLSFLNHRQALCASLDLLKGTQGHIHSPTLIVHGQKDPLFPPDHGKHLAATISGSFFMPIETMGHNFNRCFHERVIDKVKWLAGFVN